MKSQNRKNLTFLWIPDADRSVRSFRLNKRLSLLIFVAAALVLAFSIYYHITLEHNYQAEIRRLMKQRDQEYAHYFNHITNKNEYIANLQNELFLLSQQTETVQLKMQQLKQLEDDLMQLISLHENADSERNKKVVAAAGAASSRTLGIGGESQRPEQAHWESLTQETRKKLHHLQSDMARLSSHFEELKQELLEQERRLRFTPSIWPVDSRMVSSGYGIRMDPFTRRASFHSGTDFAGKTGDAIYATADGTVSETGKDSMKGNYILLKHDYGWSTMYMHLSRIEVRQGDTIEKGERIGQMGSTGRSTGPHLHYEVWQHGSSVNPALYLSH